VQKLSLVLEVLKAPRQTIRCFGDTDARDIFDYFTSRHPKLPIFRRKTFGPALREIPKDPAEVQDGSQFSQMRRKVRKARKAGYRFAPIDPLRHFDDILRVNLSSESRQGEEMPAEYVDPDRVREEMSRSGEWFGVFAPDDRLAAYAYVPVFGETFVFWKILGSADALDDGVMYLLVAEVLEEMARRRQHNEGPRWAMYDMYIGGGNGLREFKRRTGFAPRRVTWRWDPYAS